MLLTKSEFDAKLAAGQLPLALIGMSSVGKTHRARDLAAEEQFQFVHVDDVIALRIADRLPVADVHGMAVWMGTPDLPGYAEREAQYLELEEEETARVKAPETGNFVLDTTGSSIYLSETVHSYLRENFLIIHLAATTERQQIMIERFFASPKPVVWGASFAPEPGESGPDALRRCYPHLLEWRYARYEQLADATVPGWNGKHEHHSAAEFLDMIRAQLPD